MLQRHHSVKSTNILPVPRALTNLVPTGFVPVGYRLFHVLQETGIRPDNPGVNPISLSPQLIGAALPATILIVDDHPEARITIRSLLDWHGFHVCGEGKDGQEAIDKVLELKPDIVLLDINMRVMSGTQAALEIRRLSPETKILFFTIHEAPALINVLRHYAHGFVSKSAAGTELIPMVNRLARTRT